jgi:hypothetical protein
MSSAGDRQKAAPVAWADPAMVLQIIEHNRKIGEMMAAVARVTGGGAVLDQAKRDFWEQGIAALYPVPGQRHDTPLINTPITKRGRQMLTKKDLKRARRIAKTTGCSLEAALIALNKVSVASYRGDDVLRKAARLAALSPKQQQAVYPAPDQEADR